LAAIVTLLLAALGAGLWVVNRHPLERARSERTSGAFQRAPTSETAGSRPRSVYPPAAASRSSSFDHHARPTYALRSRALRVLFHEGRPLPAARSRESSCLASALRRCDACHGSNQRPSLESRRAAGVRRCWPRWPSEFATRERPRPANSRQRSPIRPTVMPARPIWRVQKHPRTRAVGKNIPCAARVPTQASEKRRGIATTAVRCRPENLASSNRLPSGAPGGNGPGWFATFFPNPTTAGGRPPKQSFPSGSLLCRSAHERTRATHPRLELAVQASSRCGQPAFFSARQLVTYSEQSALEIATTERVLPPGTCIPNDCSLSLHARAGRDRKKIVVGAGTACQSEPQSFLCLT